MAGFKKSEGLIDYKKIANRWFLSWGLTVQNPKQAFV
jgi:hypothetical protein